MISIRKAGATMTNKFDYDRVMEIANRLEELGVPEKTIKAIKKWAKKRKRDQ